MTIFQHLDQARAHARATLQNVYQPTSGPLRYRVGAMRHPGEIEVYASIYSDRVTTTQSLPGLTEPDLFS